MIELLILYVLLDQKSTIYGIKRNIEEKFSYFIKVSFGTIHPAVKRLEAGKYVSVKASLSSGGQRSSNYAITETGKEYFRNLLMDEMPDNPAQGAQLTDLKLMMLSKVDPESQKLILGGILEYLEKSKFVAQSLLDELQTSEEKLQKKLVGYKIQKIDDYIDWINSISHFG